MHEPATRGSSRGLPVPAPHASKRELLKAKRKLQFKCNVFEGRQQENGTFQKKKNLTDDSKLK